MMGLTVLGRSWRGGLVMRASRIVLLSLGFTLVVVVGLTLVSPSLDDLFVENPYWNGLSTFYRSVDPVRLESLGDWGGSLVPAGNSTLFIIGPDSGFDSVDSRVVYDYLLEGGRVVLMDDFGSGNMLLDGLNSSMRFTGGVVEDPLFFETDYGLPVVLGVGLGGVDEVVLNLATGVSGGVVLASTSPFSHYRGEMGEGDLGAIPVVAWQRFGEGALFVVGDSSVFINSMIDYRDNGLFLGALARGVVFIDESHLMPTRLTVVKGFIGDFYLFFVPLEIRYLCLGLVGVLVFKLKWETSDVEEEDDVVARVLERHIGWDPDLVKRIKDMRE